MSFHIFGSKLVRLKRLHFFFQKPKKPATVVEILLRSKYTRWNTFPPRATFTRQARIKYVNKLDVIFLNLVPKVVYTFSINSCEHFKIQNQIS